METATELLARFRPPALSMRMKVGLAALAVLIVGSFSTVSYVLLRNQSVPLFAHPLTQDQIGEVESRLSAWGVPYVERTNQVLVEAPRKNEVLLRLSLDGIPHEHLASTVESLSNAGAMTPQSVLDVQAREGLEADLALGIRGIEHVRDARVIIAPASTGLFADEPEQTTKASVRVELDPGAQLAPSTVNGIKTFVADGVPGLVAKNVAVVDDRGVALGTDPAADTNHDETLLQSSLQSALDTAVGPGLTLVRVRMETEPESVQRHEVRTTPIAGATIADHTIREQYKNGEKSYAKTHSNEQRGSDVVDESSVMQPGTTKRVSVAVFVDKTKAAEIPTVASLITAAAGLDKSRGDTLDVKAVAFPKPHPVAVPSESFATAELAPALPGILLTIGMVIGILVFARPLIELFAALTRRYAVATTQRLPPGSFAPQELHALLAGEPPHTSAAVLSRLPSAIAAEVLELFPPVERRNIVNRMSRSVPPIVHDIGTGVAHGVVEEPAS